MYQKGMILNLGLILLASLILVIAGCGDDKTTITNNGDGDQYVTGAADDPDFVVFKAQIEEYLTDSRYIFGKGLDNIYQLPTDTQVIRDEAAAMGPNDTVTAVYLGGWHITYISRYNEWFHDYYRDSLQFQVNSVVQEDPGPAADYMHYIRYWGYTDLSTFGPHTNKRGNADLVFTNLDSTIATINGTHNAAYEWNYISNDSTVTALFNMTTTLTDINITRSIGSEWVGGCPLSGTLAMTADESYTVVANSITILRVVAGWEVTIEITDGVAAVSVINDDTIWEFSCVVCQG